MLEPYARPFVPEAEPVRLFSLIYRIKSGNLFRRQLFVIEGKNFLSNHVTFTESPPLTSAQRQLPCTRTVVQFRFTRQHL